MVASKDYYEEPSGFTDHDRKDSNELLYAIKYGQLL